MKQNWAMNILRSVMSWSLFEYIGKNQKKWQPTTCHGPHYQAYREPSPIKPDLELTADSIVSTVDPTACLSCSNEFPLHYRHCQYWGPTLSNRSGHHPDGCECHHWSGGRGLSAPLPCGAVEGGAQAPRNRGRVEHAVGSAQPPPLEVHCQGEREDLQRHDVYSWKKLGQDTFNGLGSLLQRQAS